MSLLMATIQLYFKISTNGIFVVRKIGYCTTNSKYVSYQDDGYGASKQGWERQRQKVWDAHTHTKIIWYMSSFVALLSANFSHLRRRLTKTSITIILTKLRQAMRSFIWICNEFYARICCNLAREREKNAYTNSDANR